MLNLNGLHLFSFCFVIFAVCIAYFKDGRVNDLTSNIDGVDLISEKNVTETIQSPYILSQLIIDEFNLILSSKTGWTTDLYSDLLVVQSKAVIGELESHGIPIQRASAIVNCDSPQSLYHLITSPTGFSIIDPISPAKEQYEVPLISFCSEDGRLEVARTTCDICPLLIKKREFIVYNIMKESSLTFVSKSILLPANIDEKTFSNTSNMIRAINTFGLRIESLNATTCRILGVNYLYGIVPVRYIQNYINKKLAFQGIFQRLREYVDGHKE